MQSTRLSYRDPGIPIWVLFISVLLFPMTSHTATNTPMTSQFGSEEVSFIQTGYRVYDFAVKFSRRIELVADEINAKTRDPELRRQTLLWKMNTSATINLTINHIEPMAASIDLWAMASQMTDFYTTGKGKTSFGEFQAMVVQTSQEMELQAREITRSIIAPKYFQILEPELKKWVKENPFEDYSFARSAFPPRLLLLYARQ